MTKGYNKTNRIDYDDCFFKSAIDGNEPEMPLFSLETLALICVPSSGTGNLVR